MIWGTNGMPTSFENIIASYAVEFRDRADMDYVSARHLYRMGLMPPFLWSSQQAIEKYLKAAILFFGGTVKMNRPGFAGGRLV